MMKIVQIKSNEEIERDFAAFLQEGYASGSLSHSHSKAISLTEWFLKRYGEVLEEIEKKEEIKALRDRILGELWTLYSAEQNFAHMELFLAEFVHCLESEDNLGTTLEQILELFESVEGFRSISLKGLLGLSAMYLYQQIYPVPTENQALAP